MARKPRAPKKSTTKKSASKVASGTTEVSFSKQNVIQKASDIEKAEKAKAKTQKVEFKAKPQKVTIKPTVNQGSQVKIKGQPFAFSGRIVEAYYSNPELDTVEIMWTDGEVNRSYHLKVDEDDDQFKALLSEYSYESLDEATRMRNEAGRQAFRDAFHRYATDHGLYGHGADGTGPEEKQADLSIIFDYDEEDPLHKEELFKLKLKMFEQDAVKESDNSAIVKTLKKEIRTSKTPLEALVIYSELIK